MNTRMLILAISATILMGLGATPAIAHSSQPAPEHIEFAASATAATQHSAVSHRGVSSDWTWIDPAGHERFDPTEARHGHDGHTITWDFHQRKGGSGYNADLIRAAYRNLHDVTGWQFRQVHRDAAADIIITWKAGQGAGVLATSGPTQLSYRLATGHWAIVRSVIHLSPGFRNYESPVQRRIVIEHESGHALGLGHAHGADAQNEIMGPTIGYSTTKAFGRVDVDGFQHVSVWAGPVR